MRRKPQAQSSRNPPAGGLREKTLQLGDALDLPAQLLPGFSHVELWQNRSAVVDGVRGVLGYSEDCVQLNLGSLVVTFRGAGFVIKTYQQEQLQLTGTIAEIHYTT